jgi:hypothetical protein
MTTIPLNPASRTVAGPMRSRQPMLPRRFWTNTFIIWHLTAISIWSLPFQPTLKAVVDRLTRPYLLFTGAWQAWDMFSPDPIQIRTRMDATVSFRDGSRATWTFPEMAKLGLIERFQKERYRKWGQDNVRSDANWRLWEPTASYIARQYADPKNPPVRVELHRHWSPVRRTPPPAVVSSATRWSHFTFYRMAVHREDL